MRKLDKIIIEIIESYNNYLLKLPEGCKSIANEMRNEKKGIALNLIFQFSEGVDWLVKVNQQLHLLGYVNPLEHDKIQEFLNEVNEGIEIQDFILVADLFEYEFKPLFEKCKLYEISNN